MGSHMMASTDATGSQVQEMESKLDRERSLALLRIEKVIELYELDDNHTCK